MKVQERVAEVGPGYNFAKGIGQRISGVLVVGIVIPDTLSAVDNVIQQLLLTLRP